MESFNLIAATTTAEALVPPWLTTAVYLWLAMLCGRAWWEDRRDRRPRRKMGSPLWLGLLVFFLALGVARPFGAQAVLTDLARQRAVKNDWYDVRRKFQFEVVLASAALAAAGALAIGWLAARRRSWRDLSVLAPIVLLLGFLAVRATSLHYVDAVLYKVVAGVRVNTVVELLILGLVAVSIIDRTSRKRREHVAAAASAPAREDGDVGARRYSIPGAGPRG